MVDRASVPPTAPAPAAPAPAPAVDVQVRPIPGGQQTKGFGGRVEAMPAQAAPAAQEPAAGDRPAGLPEKFKSVDDLIRAYGELEGRLGQPAAPAAPAPKPAADAHPADAVRAKITTELAEKGDVSPETRQEFTKATGLPADYIDQHVTHMRAAERAALDAARTRLGGEAAVRELLGWAGKRLSAAEQRAFNEAVVSGNPALTQLAVDGLSAKFELENGRSPRTIAGRRPQDTYGGIQPFQSADEWSRARKDPRYKSDPSYRQEVEDRLKMGSEMGLL